MNFDYYQGKRGITSTGLKIIAVIIMLIDHIGASVLERFIMANGATDAMNSFDFSGPMGNYIIGDVIVRLFGRLAFPIFCFCMVEGFHYTSSRRNYLSRMALFALISEVPFDFAHKFTAWDFSHQNVFFTFTIAMAGLWLGEIICEKRGPKKGNKLIMVATMVVACIIAYILNTDYDILGILTIYVMYFVRERGRKRTMAWGSLVLTLGNPIEFTAFLDVIILHFYNGKRGRGMKYFFYIFYPLHLLILGIICAFMGL
ncbi:MAG: conjugal transfer protein TraX [Lachnospiraceae bacterium]|nr:conjugal transfer protein TraX [Lachnospiraceae bacterium]